MAFWEKLYLYVTETKKANACIYSAQTVVYRMLKLHEFTEIVGPLNVFLNPRSHL